MYYLDKNGNKIRKENAKYYPSVSDKQNLDGDESSPSKCPYWIFIIISVILLIWLIYRIAKEDN